MKLVLNTSERFLEKKDYLFEVWIIKKTRIQLIGHPFTQLIKDKYINLRIS